MKKALILIIVAICFFQFQGFTQKAVVGLTAGVTSSNIYGQVNGLDQRGDARAGYTVGMLVDAPLGNTLWSFQPGLHYVQKGKVGPKTANTKVITALRYAEFDFNFIHYTKGANKLFFGVGPYLAMNLPSKKVTITNGNRVEENLTLGKGETDAYRGVDYGANGIIGARFKCNFYVAVNYAFGIQNMIPQPTGDDHLRNGCLGVRLGYFFKNTPAKK